MCAELADLAMQLARAAAARSLADGAAPEQPLAPPPATPPAEPPSLKTTQPPASPETAPGTNPTPAPAPRATPTRAAIPKPTDPAILFTRLAAVVRDCIALEARLAAGRTAPPPPALPPTTSTPRPDPRRIPVREALHHTTRNHPNRATLARETATRLDAHLAADPDQTLAAVDILDALCDEFGIEIDFSTLPDKYLDVFCETANVPGDTPTPRATSPP